jgi:hypothetical protein
VLLRGESFSLKVLGVGMKWSCGKSSVPHKAESTAWCRVADPRLSSAKRLPGINAFEFRNSYDDDGIRYTDRYKFYIVGFFSNY